MCTQDSQPACCNTGRRPAQVALVEQVGVVTTVVCRLKAPLTVRLWSSGPVVGHSEWCGGFKRVKCEMWAVRCDLRRKQIATLHSLPGSCSMPTQTTRVAFADMFCLCMCACVCHEQCIAWCGGRKQVGTVLDTSWSQPAWQITLI